MGLFRRTKNNNKPLLRQILDLIPKHLFIGSINRFKSDKHCSKYKTYDQLVSLMFGQLNKCYTLEDISTGIGVSGTFIADLGLFQSPARSTMSDGNSKRNWQVFEMLYFKLLKYYKSVLLSKHRGQIIEEIEHKTIKLIDSTIVSLCLSLFSWAKYRTAKGGLKIHTCWDDALMLPDLINITEAAIADIKGLPQRIFPTGTIIVEDRGYFDFDLMRARTEADNWFVTRLKNTTVLEVIATRPIPDDINHLCILSDEEIQLTGTKAVETGVEVFAFRRVRVYHKRKDRFIELITNNFEWSAATISALYKKRWDIELFFKAMKQNLQIKTFVGTSENAVRSQIYVALICYLLLELMRRNTCKSAHAFSNFVEKIRICLCHYLSIDRVCNHVCQGAKSVKAVQSEDLFSGNIRGAPNKNDTLRLQFP